MRATSAKYKQIIASGNARKYVIKVDMTLVDNTVLHLTEEDIWEDSLSIETASSGTSSFDIGTAVIGQCKFSLNNFDESFSQYDFFNASAVVWAGLEGDTDNNDQQVYYRLGFFTVDEPTFASSLIQLVLLDNMWKFDVPFSEVTLNYPTTALNAVLAICSYCGVTLDQTTQFHGYNFTIAEAPKDADNMNCRDVLQYIAMLGCNFCCITPEGKLKLRWYNTSATSAETVSFDKNFSTTFGTYYIGITGVKFIIDKTEYSIGSAGYVLELENPLVNESNVSAALNSIWYVLQDFTLRTFNISTAADLSSEIGDYCKIKDYKGNYIYSWITLNTFKTAGQIVQCNAITPARSLTKQYSKTVQAAVEVAREQTNEIISNYDLAVQMMNDLAVNAMGGYEDYEDLSTGGRVWYLSNMPITKNPTTGVCSFETGSTVYKKSGDGFYVSRDGGQTWVNGYNMSTGELVVNVLDAIGINFDWARGGTLTLGGYGNGNGVLSILNSSNVEKVHGDNDGLKVGGTTGSRIHINTYGEMRYDYDNAYGGKIHMDAVNYGTQENPDLRDTFLIEDFNDIGLRSNDDMSEIYLSTQEDEQTGYDNGYVRLYGHKQTDESSYQYSELQVDGDGIHFGGASYKGGTRCPSPTVQIVEQDMKVHEYEYADGFLKTRDNNFTPVEIPNSRWHTWTASNVNYVAIMLGVGVTDATFPDLDADDDISYEPHIKCASGVAPPKITDMVRTGNSLTVTFTAVTAAQVGSPVAPATSECVIKLLRIKG